MRVSMYVCIAQNTKANVCFLRPIRTRARAHTHTHTCTCTCTHTQDLAEAELTKEQAGMIGKGFAGPPVAFHGEPLTDTQVLKCILDEYNYLLFIIAHNETA